ncbi:MAG: cysteine--tRNA ligase [Actinobacteria bacterium]|nr:cysteine--tRNA ligase [Actinomycetota bacterium]
MVRIHDTLLGRDVELEPRVPGRVSIYVCGPTVYEVPHVGHGRTALVYDVIRRYLEWRGFAVAYVSNVTNVDDRIIARAAAEGATEQEISARYEATYWAELERLGVRRPDDVPHATEFIEPMVDLIAQLVASGHAYVIEGEGVYFAVDSYGGYGELSHRRLGDLLDSAGSRVDVDERKRSPVDFALWKAAKPGEPDWDSPWGRGRPGWHIECSAMSLELLGEGFDIHGGGDDLVFPHHENERAQAEAAGHEFARHWIHSGMVMIGGEKMSKSLGNFTTLGEAIDAHGDRAFRLAVLQVHYRSQMELGDTELRAAAEAVGRLDALVRRTVAAGIAVTGVPVADDVADRFRAAMDDDFGTPGGVGVVFDTVRRANSAIDAGDEPGAARLVATVVELAGALGLEVGAGETVAERDAEIDAMVAERDAARATKDFAAADRLRDELTARGITLEDTPRGTVWHR